MATFITILVYLNLLPIFSKTVRPLKQEFTYNLQQIYIAIGTGTRRRYFDRRG